MVVEDVARVLIQKSLPVDLVSGWPDGRTPRTCDQIDAAVGSHGGADNVFAVRQHDMVPMVNSEAGLELYRIPIS